MLGIAIGIIMSTIIVAAWPNKPETAKQLSDEQIIEKAKLLGMINPTDGTHKEDITIDQTAGSSDKNSKEGEESFVVLNVVKGMTVSDIASILKNTNLINDTNTFINEVRKAGLITRLQVGTFKVKKGSSMEEIIKTLFSAQ